MLNHTLCPFLHAAALRASRRKPLVLASRSSDASSARPLAGFRDFISVSPKARRTSNWAATIPNFLALVRAICRELTASDISPKAVCTRAWASIA